MLENESVYLYTFLFMFLGKCPIRLQIYKRYRLFCHSFKTGYKIFGYDKQYTPTKKSILVICPFRFYLYGIINVENQIIVIAINKKMIKRNIN